jgi:hypothetical protein
MAEARHMLNCRLQGLRGGGGADEARSGSSVITETDRPLKTTTDTSDI